MITLYSTHCPKCKVIEMKLDKFEVDYALVDDPQKVVAKGKECGILSAPILDVDGEALDFAAAVKFLSRKD